ncbi:hypothetical protein BC830DRAFT_529320 [Chytriomyces sp. MP71]|nr:hypothetical protein BC830DRAFT_634991 [Chytriomyces sp. MP71]KAI8612814.1 hypothetical protein BC830DRAFT_529320 [Chytriomyces sp. MP71]
MTAFLSGKMDHHFVVGEGGTESPPARDATGIRAHIQADAAINTSPRSVCYIHLPSQPIRDPDQQGRNNGTVVIKPLSQSSHYRFCHQSPAPTSPQTCPPVACFGTRSNDPHCDIDSGWPRMETSKHETEVRYMENLIASIHTELPPRLFGHCGNPGHIYTGSRASKRQVHVLKRIYEEHPFPTRDMMQVIAMQMCMAPNQVKNWFQNYRSKLKKLERDDGRDSPEPPAVLLMRKQNVMSVQFLL